MKKIFKLIYLIISIYLSMIVISFAKINIIASVENEIITNYDVLRESRYLKVLNPNLKNLDINQISNLAKQSLIKEIIKKKEISKFFSLEKENLFVDDQLTNLLIKLGYEDKKSFKDDLLINETYSLDEIKLKIKIEIFWNELIFNRFNNQVVINEEKLIQKINKLENKKTKEFFLSEIVFKKDINENIDNTIIKIQKSIEEIGFDNTANLYSISESSKFGGKVGWIKEESLSKKIYDKIKKLEVNEYTDVIKLENNFIILRIDEIKIVKDNIDRKKEFQKILQVERNKKLEKFSRIFFNKTKKNYSINEK